MLSNYVCLVILVGILVSIVSGDRLSDFYDRLSKPDTKSCEDKTKLLPDCTQCIPGLEKPAGSNSCTQYIASSRQIREEIRNLVIKRFGDSLPANRSYGLYPYLEKPEFLHRHYTLGKLLAERKITNMIDIGAYYNPIHLFLPSSQCISSVLIVEPILDPASVMVPCDSSPNQYTHFLVLPITFKHYISIKDTLPIPETVVCIGCDSHYGPNRKMLETTFPRPYSLYIEYPSEYVHNAPFRRMNGDGQGETMAFKEQYRANTTETIYTKRVMKVIHYQ